MSRLGGRVSTLEERDDEDDESPELWGLRDDGAEVAERAAETVMFEDARRCFADRGGAGAIRAE